MREPSGSASRIEAGCAAGAAANSVCSRRPALPFIVQPAIRRAYPAPSHREGLSSELRKAKRILFFFIFFQEGRRCIVLDPEPRFGVKMLDLIFLPRLNGKAKTGHHRLRPCSVHCSHLRSARQFKSDRLRRIYVRPLGRTAHDHDRSGKLSRISRWGFRT